MRYRLTSADGFGISLGCFATIAQVVLMREALSVVGGNELAVVLGLATWLIGVGLGAWLALPLSRLRGVVSTGAISATALVAGGVSLLRLHRIVLRVFAGTDPSLPSLVLVIGLGLGVGGLSAGFLFTAAARAALDGVRAPVSRLYGMEAVGALAGGLLFTFVLAGRLPHLSSVGLSGGLLIAAATPRHHSPLRGLVGFAMAASLIVAAVFPLRSLDRNLTEQAYSALGQGRLRDVRESPYGRLALVASEDQVSLFVDGRFQYAFPDPWERPVPVHLALTEHPRPKRVLILGGGASDRLEAALSHHPDEVVMTTLDRQIYDMCAPFWPESTRRAVADPRVRVVLDDGRRYLTQTTERFDVVLVSVPPPESAGANRYHTVEFYKTVARILNPGGVVTVVAPGGENVLAPEAARAAASSLRTVRAVFSETVLVPGLQILIHAANQKGVLTEDPARLAKRYRQRAVDARSFSAYRFESIYVKARIASVLAQLAKQTASVNSDEKPAVFLANLQLRERSLGQDRKTRDATVIGGLERSAAWWLALPFFAAAIAVTPLRRRPSSRFRTAIVSIVTTGAAGMATEVLILYAFQASEGTLYVGLALITALFMTGLAVGAFISRRILARPRPWLGPAADTLVLVLLVTTGPLISLSHLGPVVPGAWSLTAGAVTGAAFPVFLALAAEKRQGDERAAAAGVEAADHLGAAFGALVTGVIWLPVFGVTVTCLMFAALKAVSLTGQILSSR